MICDVGNIAGIPQQQSHCFHCRNPMWKVFWHILHL